MRIKCPNIKGVGVVLLFVYSVIVITPYLNRNLPPVLNGILFVIASGWICFISTSFPSVEKIPTLYFWIIIHVLQSVIYYVVDLSTCSFAKLLAEIMCFLSIITFCQFSRISIDQKIGFYILSIFVIVINVVDNIRLNLIYPNASEGLNFAYGEAYLEMNIGDSAFCGFVSLVATLCFLAAILEKKNIYLFIVIVCAIYLYITSRMLALITFVVGIVMVLLVLATWNKRPYKRMAQMAGVVCIIAVFSMFLPNVLYKMSEMVSSQRLAPRLREFASILRFSNIGTNGYSSLGSGRIELYIMSIKTWLANPANFLFGIGVHPSEVPLLNSVGIGAHSSFFDFLAEYGIIGLMSLFYILKLSYATIYKRIRNPKLRVLSKGLYVLFIMTALVNNVFSITFFIMIYAIIPSYLEINDYKIVKEGL